MHGRVIGGECSQRCISAILKKANKMSKKLLLVVIALGVLILAGGSLVATRAFMSKGRSSTPTTRLSTNQAPQSDQLIWEATEDRSWKANGTAPACPDPLQFESPTDVSKATSILYPGQYRGGEYKPHGGFRFDESVNNEITVKMPMDAFLYRGSRYLVNGEIQYVFDFINNCGIMHRFGHLLELSSRLTELADQLPEPKEGDSRDTRFSSSPLFTAGEVIATSVGVTKGGVNNFFDWGVYDLRQTNQAWEDPAWRSEHADWQGVGNFAVCWFDLLPAADSARVRSLPPADGKSGATSDFCR